MTLLAAVLAVLGVLVTCQPALVWLRRRRIRRLAEALGDLPPLGTLEASLARALGDPEIRVAYWLPESRRYVGAGRADRGHVDVAGQAGAWRPTARRGAGRPAQPGRR